MAASVNILFMFDSQQGLVIPRAGIPQWALAQTRLTSTLRSWVESGLQGPGGQGRTVVSTRSLSGPL